MQGTKLTPTSALIGLQARGRALLARVSKGRVLSLAAALFVLAGVLVPASLHAAFTAPVDLSGDGGVDAQVAMNPDGNAVAVWRGSNGAFTPIEARARSATGVFGPLETLATGGFEPRVALAAGGDALIVWRRRGGSGPCSASGCYVIQARPRSADGMIGAVRTLSSSSQDADRPEVAIDAEGDAVVVWRRFDGTGPNPPCRGVNGCFRAQARSRSAGGALGPVQTLSPAGQNALPPQVAIDAEGDALAVWSRAREDAGNRVQGRTLSAAGVLGPVQAFSPGVGGADEPHVAVDPDGDALVVWRGFVNGTARIQARGRSAGGTLGPVQTLSMGGSFLQKPEVAIDADGDALVVWRTSDGAVQARARSASGGLGPVHTLTEDATPLVDPEVAIEADGDGVAVWGQFDGVGPCGSAGCLRIHARTLSASGVLGPVQILSPSGRDAWDPEVAADADGGALAVWELRPPSGQSCCTRVQAAAGP